MESIYHLGNGEVGEERKKKKNITRKKRRRPEYMGRGKLNIIR